MLLPHVATSWLVPSGCTSPSCCWLIFTFKFKLLISPDAIACSLHENSCHDTMDTCVLLLVMPLLFWCGYMSLLSVATDWLSFSIYQWCFQLINVVIKVLPCLSMATAGCNAAAMASPDAIASCTAAAAATLLLTIAHWMVTAATTCSNAVVINPASLSAVVTCLCCLSPLIDCQFKNETAVFDLINVASKVLSVLLLPLSLAACNTCCNMATTWCNTVAVDPASLFHSSFLSLLHITTKL